MIAVGVLTAGPRTGSRPASAFVVLPSLVLLGSGAPHVLQRIQDWHVYRDAFAKAFGQIPALAAE